MPLKTNGTKYIYIDAHRYYHRHEVCWGLTAREILKAIVSFLLPLSLGVFTAFVTLYQQQVATQQRLEDRQIAHVRREQDLNISALQRQLDKSIAQQQREEDEYRRDQDLNISALQRDLDIHIAEVKRLADDLNAEKQRDMLLTQRILELEIEQQRYDQERTKYLDNILLSYINDIGLLVERHNGSLRNTLATAALARAKTLNVVRQLGPNRSIPLLEFLYDIEQISVSKPSIDLSGAQLDGLDLSTFSSQIMKNISFSGVYLNNASFAGQDVSFWNFSGAHLHGASFIRANCTHTIFDGADLLQSDFSYSTFKNATFKNVNFEGVTFVGIHGMPKQLNYVRFDRTNFSHIDFGDSGVEFLDSQLANSIFRYSKLRNVRFLYSDLRHADFGYAQLENVSFQGSFLVSANFEYVTIKGLINMQYTNLTSANMLGLTCSPDCPNLLVNVLSLANTILLNGTLSSFHPPLLPDGHAGQIKNEWAEDIGAWQLLKTSNTSKSRVKVANDRDRIVFTPDMNEAEKRKNDISMYQQINLIETTSTRVNYKSLIHLKRARLTIRSTASLFMGIYVYEEGSRNGKRMNISGHAHRDSNTQSTMTAPLPSIQDHQTSFVLNSNTEILRVIVEFPRRHVVWCEYVALDIRPLMEKVPDD